MTSSTQLDPRHERLLPLMRWIEFQPWAAHQTDAFILQLLTEHAVAEHRQHLIDRSLDLVSKHSEHGVLPEAKLATLRDLHTGHELDVLELRFAGTQSFRLVYLVDDQLKLDYLPGTLDVTVLP